MGDGNDEGAVVPEVRGVHGQGQAIAEGKEIFPGVELKAEQRPGVAEELCRPVMLGMIGKARVINPLHRRVGLKQGRQGRGIGAGPIEAQSQRFRPQGQGVRSLRRQARAKVPEALLPQLGQGLPRRRRAAVSVEDVGVAIPGEEPRVRYGPPKGSAMAADVFGEGVHHEVRPHGLRLKEPGRGHGVIHHKDNAALGAEGADGLEVGDLGTRVGDGFYKHHARFRPQRGLHGVHGGGIHEADVDPLPRKALKQAVGIAEEEGGGQEVVTPAEQGKEDGADGGHARGKGHGPHAPFHGGHFGF